LNPGTCHLNLENPSIEPRTPLIPEPLFRLSDLTRTPNLTAELRTLLNLLPELYRPRTLPTPNPDLIFFTAIFFSHRRCSRFHCRTTMWATYSDMLSSSCWLHFRSGDPCPTYAPCSLSHACSTYTPCSLSHACPFSTLPGTYHFASSLFPESGDATQGFSHLR
jgi:hypothetical protein